MAQIQNYNKTCPDCNGEPYKIVGYKRLLFFGKIPVLKKICFKCTLGIIKPKQIILSPYKKEPIIIY